MTMNSYEKITDNEHDEKAKEEAEKYLTKRMNWTPRNEEEEDLFNMGLESLLENYI